MHNIAVDSHGNVSTTEVDTGKRAQRFRLVTPLPRSPGRLSAGSTSAEYRPPRRLRRAATSSRAGRGRCTDGCPDGRIVERESREQRSGRDYAGEAGRRRRRAARDPGAAAAGRGSARGRRGQRPRRPQGARDLLRVVGTAQHQFRPPGPGAPGRVQRGGADQHHRGALDAVGAFQPGLQRGRRVVEPGDDAWDGLNAEFPEYPGARSVVLVDVERVADSCGFAVPLYEYKGERSQLVAYAEKMGPEGLEAYKSKKNRTSIDGIAGLRSAGGEG